jgi:hypothetical protein
MHGRRVADGVRADPLLCKAALLRFGMIDSEIKALFNV